MISYNSTNVAATEVAIMGSSYNGPGPQERPATLRDLIHILNDLSPSLFPHVFYSFRTFSVPHPLTYIGLSPT